MHNYIAGNETGLSSENTLTSLKCCHCHWVAEWSQLNGLSSNGKLVLIVCMKRANDEICVVSFLCVIGQNACASLILADKIVSDHSILLVR